MRLPCPWHERRDMDGSRPRTTITSAAAKLARACIKAPIHLYRLTLRPWLGWPCRHLPTCSDYALEAVDRNGAWRGLWLIVSRLARCQPWGTAGFDPVPDIRAERFSWRPWKYGRWSGRDVVTHWPEHKATLKK